MLTLSIIALCALVGVLLALLIAAVDVADDTRENVER